MKDDDAGSRQNKRNRSRGIVFGESEPVPGAEASGNASDGGCSGGRCLSPCSTLAVEELRRARVGQHG